MRQAQEHVLGRMPEFVHSCQGNMRRLLSIPKIDWNVFRQEGDTTIFLRQSQTHFYFMAQLCFDFSVNEVVIILVVSL
jgi:imidazoleglycerol phosphate synthase glutamine amidotransferase subunit HisH